MTPDDDPSAELPASAADVLTLQSLHTRFLLPFVVTGDKAADACSALRLAETAGIPRLWQAWDEPTHAAHDGQPADSRQPARLQAAYADELLDNVRDFLFPPSAGGGCSYFRLRPEMAQRCFPHGIEVELASHTKPVPIRLDRPGIELFVTAQGVGVLSLALVPDTESLGDHDALEFNYRLARNHAASSARFHVPEPDPKHPLPAEATARMEAAKDLAAPLDRRLGVAGARYTLGEMCEALLEPIGALGVKRVQWGFSVYTVAHFGTDVALTDPAHKEALARLVSSLSQIEEGHHAGAAEDSLGVHHAFLNRHHWAAVGLLGAAHLIADQPPDADGEEHPFNPQRIARVRDKYFMPYLIALLQRQYLNRTVGEAGDIVLDSGLAARHALAALRQRLLVFGVEGYFSQVSSRQALHRFYRIAQHGLDIPAAWEQARDAIADLDAKYAAEDQAQLAESQYALAQSQLQIAKEQREMNDSMDKNLGVIAHVQTIVHIIEYFLVSVYMAHLWDMMATDNVCLQEAFKESFWSGLGYLWNLVRAHGHCEPTGHGDHDVVSTGIVYAAGLGILLMIIVDLIRSRRHRRHRKAAAQGS